MKLLLNAKTHDMLNEENQRTKLHVPYKLNLKKKQHI